MSIDLRLKQLSYSSLLSLHSCPRKFELKKLESSGDIEALDPCSSEAVTFSVGHAVGTGVAEVFIGLDEDTIVWNMFLAWEADLLAENTRQHKSFWLSVIAVQKIIAMRKEGFLVNWEIVSYLDKPAIELSFIINFPDGFVYRGYVDAVLRNKLTGEIKVLECKTSSAYELNAASYKNSAQAIGYSIVLDHIFPELSSYKVLYLIYRTKQMLYESMEFTKSFLARAQWIQELLLDIENIKLYNNADIFPMRGQSCNDWGRPCEYFNVCTMSNSHLTKKLTPETIDKITQSNSQFQIKVSLQDLIAAQLAKAVT